MTIFIMQFGRYLGKILYGLKGLKVSMGGILDYETSEYENSKIKTSVKVTRLIGKKGVC